MVRRVFSVIAVLMFVGILFAQEVAHRHITSIESATDTLQSGKANRANNTTPQRRRIDFMADEVKPYNRGKDSIVYFVGNFAAHHNGAVISCDSAVRFSDRRWGFFSRVLINQDSIYIYGNSAIYDGDIGSAEIFAPIIKVVDGDALLYTYNFKFNTESKVGCYNGGGVLLHDNNIIESVRGYYDAEKHDIICVGNVELHGEQYDMKSDSIIYNTDTEFARFFSNSEIWNADGDYLSADEGAYNKTSDLYSVTRNGYILSQNQEIWGDTLSYYRSDGHMLAYGNIQMDDFEQKMLVFGDYAEYWTDPGDMLLTRNPSAISYDLEQSDSIFMRADTLEIFTISVLAEREQAERAAAEALAQQERQKVEARQAAEQRSKDLARKQEESAQAAEQQKKIDELYAAVDEELESEEAAKQQAADSLQNDTIPQLSAKELKAQQQKQAKEQARKIKEEAKREKAKLRKQRLDSIAAKRQAKVNIQLDKARAKEMERIAKDSVRRAAKRAKLLAKGEDVSALDSLDSLAAIRNERVLRNLRQRPDTLQQVTQPQIDSTASQQSQQQSAVEVTDSIAEDSVYRLVKAYRNVKMYRSDAQMVCDSLVSSSQDSIVHLLIAPVMWNASNQLAATTIDLYTHNQKLKQAIFNGEPIMVADIDSSYYNQITGKMMTALFRDNNIYRNDVEGNVQTIYFQREDEQSAVVTEMIYLESASATFYIEDKELVGVTYRNDVPFTMYPINQIPDSQPLRLQNFKWVPQLRPTLEDVFDRKIRPTQREKSIKRSRPTFNIVQRMDRRKEALISSGMWVDREDELTPELIEWRNSRERE